VSHVTAFSFLTSERSCSRPPVLARRLAARVLVRLGGETSDLGSQVLVVGHDPLGICERPQPEVDANLGGGLALELGGELGLVLARCLEVLIDANASIRQPAGE
jgi:hypothetical protein